MTFELMIGFILLLICSIAGIGAFVALLKAEKTIDSLENIIFDQEYVITEHELTIDEMAIEIRHLKTKISLLELELEEKK